MNKRKIKLTLECILLCTITLVATIFISPSKAGDNQKVSSVSNIWDIETQYEFVVQFENIIANVEDIEVEKTDITTGNIIDKIFINGHSIRTINSVGTDENGLSIEPTAVSVRITKPRDYKEYALEFYFEKRLVEEYNLKLDGTDTILFKKGLQFPLGGALAEDVTYRYDADNENWSKILNRTVEYRETKAVQVEFSANTDGSKNNTVFYIKFDRPASYQHKPYVASSNNYWKSIMEAGIVNYTQSQLDDIQSFGIRDSVLDKISIDGKSIREWMDAETDVTYINPETGLEETIPAEFMKQVAIQATYEGSSYQGGKVLGIYFNSNSKCILDLEKEHTLTISSDFITPLLTKTTTSQTFVWLPKYQVWMDAEIASDYR